MLVVISPAKRLDFTTPAVTRAHTQPAFQADSAELIDTLRGFSPRRLTNLMGISKDLAELNHERYASWEPTFTKANSKPAIEAFRGDVYLGLDVATYSTRDHTWAQKHLRILSGLHGLLRPLDLIQPYRLEMGTALKTDRGENLYQFWGDRITSALNHALDGQRRRVLVNLASNEYFGAVKTAQLDARVVNVTFKDGKNGTYKVLSFFAKKARGLMTSYIIRNRITSVAGLRRFDSAGYTYDPAQSSPDQLVFLRPEPSN